MNDLPEIDARNQYQPDLSVIREAAERTYGEANAFYRMQQLYLRDIQTRYNQYELVDPKAIYDETHAAVSSLAECCEMYLKATYLAEHDSPTNDVNALWQQLKASDFLTDAHNNPIYRHEPDGVYTFRKYDEHDQPLLDAAGNVIYFDKNGNTYNQNNCGAKIKRDGHQLDRLIGMLSPKSRVLLELGMSGVEMPKTAAEQNTDIFAVVKACGIADPKAYVEHLTADQYNDWLEQHKNAFVTARYAGQTNSTVNLQFMYHLATQLRAVAKHKIESKTLNLRLDTGLVTKLKTLAINPKLAEFPELTIESILRQSLQQ